MTAQPSVRGMGRKVVDRAAGRRRGPRPHGRSAERGAILVLVLWLLLILSLIGLSYSSSVKTGVSIEGNRAARVKARWYARAAIERTIAELLERQEPYYSHASGFYDDQEHFAMQPVGDGFFSLLTGERGEDGEPIYGITDEASRVNLNSVGEEALYTFPEMTQEMVSGLLDWRDDDWEVRVDGAEDDYYSMLPEPYLCKNRDFQTVGELLLVSGWTEADLFGEDANENGLLDPNEDDGDRSPPLDDADGELDLGLARFFTVYSRDKELNPNGETRVDLNSASEQELLRIEGMTQKQAQAIVEWRKQNRFDSLGDLLDVTEAQKQQDRKSGGQQGGRNQNRSGGSNENGQHPSSEGGRSPRSGSSNQRSSRSTGQSSSKQAQKVFNLDQIAQIIDWVCIDTEDKTNRININTAPYEVLMTLPGMTEALAQEIMTYRESNLGPFTSRADLLQVNGMTEEVFRELIDYVTVQSYQFRIVAEGQEGETRLRIETVVDVGQDPPRILYWREW